MKINLYLSKTKPMRLYNIVETDLWFILKKSYKDDDWIITTVLYRNGRWWDFRKDSAKTYYFRDSATGALIYARKCWWNEPC